MYYKPLLTDSGFQHPHQNHMMSVTFLLLMGFLTFMVAK